MDEKMPFPSAFHGKGRGWGEQVSNNSSARERPKCFQHRSKQQKQHTSFCWRKSLWVSCRQRSIGPAQKFSPPVQIKGEVSIQRHRKGIGILRASTWLYQHQLRIEKKPLPVLSLLISCSEESWSVLLMFWSISSLLSPIGWLTWIQWRNQANLPLDQNIGRTPTFDNKLPTLKGPNHKREGMSSLSQVLPRVICLRSYVRVWLSMHVRLDTSESTKGQILQGAMASANTYVMNSFGKWQSLCAEKQPQATQSP